MILVVGQRQPKSKRLVCSGCQKTLEFQKEDLRDIQGLLYLDCPIKRCRKVHYVGTSWETLKNNA